MTFRRRREVDGVMVRVHTLLPEGAGERTFEGAEVYRTPDVIALTLAKVIRAADETVAFEPGTLLELPMRNVIAVEHPGWGGAR